MVLRAKIKKTIVDYAKRYAIPDLIEATAVVQMNDEFHRISDRVIQQLGKLDNDKIFFEWEDYLKRYIKMNYKI